MKNFKFTFVFTLLMFLDVAVLPRVCRKNITYSESIMFIFDAANSDVVHFNPKNPIKTELRVGDTFTQEMFNELFDYFFDIELAYYHNNISQSSVNYDVIINSYAINNVYLCGVEHDFDEIKIPYEIKEGDFANYYIGYRNVLVINVSLDIEYTLTEKGV